MSQRQKIIKVVAVNDRGCRIGQYHHNAKTPDEVIDKIRELHEDNNLGYRRIAKMLGLKKDFVRKICDYSRRAQTYEHWKKLVVIVELKDAVPVVVED